MLTSVANSINRSLRLVLVNHPNTCACNIFRKHSERSGETQVGYYQTLGGLGVLDSEDDDEIAFEYLGNGYILPVDLFAPTTLADTHHVANVGGEKRFLIEPEATVGSADRFEIRTHDVVYIILSVERDIKIAFEIVAVETVVNIPPYANRYVANRRADLDDPFITGGAPDAIPVTSYAEPDLVGLYEEAAH